MQLNIIIKIIVGIFSLLIITGCTPTISVFRNRDFDYARKAVYQSKLLEIPKFVSKKQSNLPTTVMILSKNLNFPDSKQKEAKQALRPPKWNNM